MQDVVGQEHVVGQEEPRDRRMVLVPRPWQLKWRMDAEPQSCVRSTEASTPR